MKSYPISSSLRQAIERLFPDPSVAYGPLGVHARELDELYEPDGDPSLSPVKRAAMLRDKLEQFIQQMAEEHEEMGSPEASETLRMHAIGLLIALRELLRHFPELQRQR
jgi:hypothetical protein